MAKVGKKHGLMSVPVPVLLFPSLNMSYCMEPPSQNVINKTGAFPDFLPLSSGQAQGGCCPAPAVGEGPVAILGSLPVLEGGLGSQHGAPGGGLETLTCPVSSSTAGAFRPELMPTGPLPSFVAAVVLLGLKRTRHTSQAWAIKTCVFWAPS